MSIQILYIDLLLEQDVRLHSLEVVDHVGLLVELGKLILAESSLS